MWTTGSIRLYCNQFPPIRPSVLPFVFAVYHCLNFSKSRDTAPFDNCGSWKSQKVFSASLKLAAATSSFPRFPRQKVRLCNPALRPWSLERVDSFQTLENRRGYKDCQSKNFTWKSMVLTKAYLRYVQSACFGVVCSLKANVVFIRKRTGNSKEQVIQYAACPALESVIVWDVRRGEKASVKLSLKSSLGRDAVEPVN